ncbi:hypothetical protein Ciccas_007128 [Cichlidogyrus casuarinus]|uniref:Parafibromin n=1 Tax=Cichlidogyrus casuarinus TaxID=1844966 RepID=A0ABD2Q4C4_9PLAT
MADVLALLREYNISNKQFRETKDEIIFGDFAWPKSTKTNYIIFGSGKEGQAKDYYTLESIMYFLKNIELSHTQYVRQAASAGLTMVRLPDRKDLLAYLKGEKASTSSIDRAAPMDISLRRNVHETSALADRDEPPEPKRSKFADVPELEVDPSKPLSEALPIDRIKALRAKFKANRQTTQANELDQSHLETDSRNLSDEVYLVKFSETMGMPRVLAFMDPKSKRSLIATDEKLIKSVTSREVRWRNRSTIIQSNAKTFYDNIVLGILRNVMMKENAPDLHMSANVRPMNNMAAVSMPKPYSSAMGAGQQAQASQMQYSRYDQERFAARQEDTAGFTIDTMATYHRKGLASMVAGGGSNDVIPSDPRAKQRDPRSNIAPGSTPDPYRSVRTANEARMIARTKSRVSRVPIIIIPATSTSMITMLNARDILQEMNFISPQDKQKSGAKRETEITIHRKRADGKTTPYRVIDQPNRLTPEDWDKVVAVFVQGQAWQFKGWPIGSDPAVLFAHVKGFNLKYTHLPTDANVSKWNVSVISLDQRKRHMDKASLQLMWDQVERHIAKTKPHLKL